MPGDDVAFLEQKARLVMKFFHVSAAGAEQVLREQPVVNPEDRKRLRELLLAYASEGQWMLRGKAPLRGLR